MLSTEMKKTKIPQRLMCSITSQIMVDPVITVDGHTYEREAIEKWLITHNSSPKTGEILKNKELTTNWDKRSDVSEFLEEHPELYEEEAVYFPSKRKVELAQAIRANKLEELQRLLGQEPRLLLALLEEDYTAFHLAASFGSSELTLAVITRLESRGVIAQLGLAPKGFKPVHLNMLLEQEFLKEDMTRATFLIGLGAELSQLEPSSGNTLLHRLSIKGKEQSVAYLLDQGADIDAQNVEGNTPLLLAILSKNKTLTKILLARKANTELSNHQGQSPLSIVVLEQDKALLKLLLPAGIAVLPPLHIALSLKAHDLLKSLIARKDQPLETLDPQKRTPFYVAVEKGDIESATLLLSAGAKANVPSGAEGLYPLHLAARQGSRPLVELLLKKGVSVDSRNFQEETPLHLATKAGQDGVIPLLLEAGANRKAKNAQHQSPMEVAVIEKHPKTLSLIENTAYALKRARLEENQQLKVLVKQQSEQLEVQARQLNQQAQQLEALKKEHVQAMQGITPLKQEIIALRQELGTKVEGLRKNLLTQVKQEKEERLKSEEALHHKILTFRGQLSLVHQSVVNPQEVERFLRLVAEGEQEQADVMLKLNRNLASVPGRVTDLSGRVFENITGLQYACWALDRHMWTMILKYVSSEQAAMQLREKGGWVSIHGLHAADGLNSPLQKLSTALKVYIDNFDQWKAERAVEARQHWGEKVGGTQLLLPAHVINEYCHPEHSFHPCPNFREQSLPRTRMIDGAEWFSGQHEDGKIGVNVAICRGNRAEPGKSIGDSLGVVSRVCGNRYKSLSSDYMALVKLTEVRTEDLKQLFLNLNIPVLATSQSCSSGVVLQFSPKPMNSSSALSVNQIEIEKFLRLVVAGEQEQAEAILKSNQGLVSVPGNVTDLSGRVFENITGFQYACCAA